MNPLVITGSLFGIALIAASAFTFVGDEPKEHLHNGVVVSCTNNLLTMTDDDGQDSTHVVTAKTRVTRDGSVCEARDLNSGTRIRVTTKDSRRGAAIAIDAFEKDAGAAE